MHLRVLPTSNLISSQLISSQTRLHYSTISNSFQICIYIKYIVTIRNCWGDGRRVSSQGSICDELTKCRKNLNLQLPTGSGLINESDLCYGRNGSEILVTYFFDFSDSSCPDPTTLHTHIQAYRVCVFTVT